MKKKILAIVLTALIGVSVAGCNDSYQEAIDKTQLSG